MNIPKSHPRFKSLQERRRIEEGFAKGVVAAAGMIAQGRGEAFDYLIGERTAPEAKKAIRAAAALLLLARRPVISVNGNAAALCAPEIAALAKAIPARIEANLFYRTERRTKLMEKEFAKLGMKILAGKPDRKIRGLESKRALVHGAGIYSADAVLVMIEDGDRTGFLRRAGKKVIAIDLNPMSRTSRKANITIVDNVVRCLPLLTKAIRKMKNKKARQLEKTIKIFNNKKSLMRIEKIVRKGMQ